MQIGTVIIPEPYMRSEYEIAKDELWIMECNVRRMRYMIENGYYVREYSDKEWIKFKKLQDDKKTQNRQT